MHTPRSSNRTLSLFTRDTLIHKPCARVLPRLLYWRDQKPLLDDGHVVNGIFLPSFFPPPPPPPPPPLLLLLSTSLFFAFERDATRSNRITRKEIPVIQGFRGDGRRFPALQTVSRRFIRLSMPGIQCWSRPALTGPSIILINYLFSRGQFSAPRLSRLSPAYPSPEIQRGEKRGGARSSSRR